MKGIESAMILVRNQVGVNIIESITFRLGSPSDSSPLNLHKVVQTPEKPVNIRDSRLNRGQDTHNYEKRSEFRLGKGDKLTQVGR
jgi:hypothetical protein